MTELQEICTADLCDAHDELLWVAEPLFGDYGGQLAFCGPISTVKAFEHNGTLKWTSSSISGTRSEAPRT